MDMTKFYTGQVLNAYEYLGAHFDSTGVTFRTFTPNAKGISLLYDNQEFPM